VKVKLWGVRGSIPTPLDNTKIRNKIVAVLARLKPEDLESMDSKERFLALLPPDLFGTVGGNTACVEVRPDDETCIIFDAGSGIYGLGQAIKKEEIKHLHIFFSHFHWDHIQGLPFFVPAFSPDMTIHFYSPRSDFEDILRNQMKPPYFPITMDVFAAKMVFTVLTGDPVRLGSTEVSYRSMKHPGGCYSYKVRTGDKQVIYSTDTELMAEDFQKTPENDAFYRNSDILILDSQYTLDEALEKYDWGHSSYSMAVDFASVWDIKKLVLFHHEPLYSDGKIHKILSSAKWYQEHMDKSRVQIVLGVEGMELSP
jgi:phosphoribosyl 1,2-cyclic phosphodiesterase